MDCLVEWARIDKMNIKLEPVVWLSLFLPLFFRLEGDFVMRVIIVLYILIGYVTYWGDSFGISYRLQDVSVKSIPFHTTLWRSSTSALTRSQDGLRR